MKKESYFIILFFLFLNLNLVNSAEEILNGTGNVDIKTGTNNILEKEIGIPENLEIFSRVLFGLKAGDKVDLQALVILIGLLVISLMLMKTIIEFMPFFENSLRGWLGAVIITLLIGVSGGFLLMADFLLDLGSLFGLLEEWGLARVVISLLLLVGFFYLITTFIKFIKNKATVAEMEATGRNIGVASAIGKIQRETLDK
ncbi:hypothetical protein HYV50_04530 [Candidatus Pacearchaeota archaeon]|nr:hypothetical protein [Candidatus Pacearchaeota archaeon]